MINNGPKLAYFGHHKCGSKMILKIVNTTCRFMGLKHAHFHSPAMWGYYDNLMCLDQIVDNMGLDFVSYISADIKFIGNKERFRGVHVIRDPRDIAVSSYFSNRYSHSTEHWPELSEFRNLLERLPKNEGLLENMKFMAKLRVDGRDLNLFDSLVEWDYSMPNVLEIKFEDLVTHPYQSFIEIFEFLGLIDDMGMSVSSAKSLFRLILQDKYPQLASFSKIRQIPAWMLFSFVYSNRFSKLSKGREMGQEDVKSHYRKGAAGDWVNHFNAQHKKYFKESYGDILVKLGYEKDNGW
jgi:hypothetical protein